MNSPNARQHGISPAPLVITELNEGIFRITLSNPAKRNTLSRPMLTAMEEAISEAAGNDAARVVVVAAEGKVFSAGHDLREVVDGDQSSHQELFGHSTRVMESLHLLPKPVIAEVMGTATAAGCQLVASCDLVVASEQASFQTPGVQIGLFCSTPMVPLSRAIPAKKALEMLFTGRSLGAHEAERAGLVNRVVPPEALRAEVLELARSILVYSTETLAIGKKAFYKQLHMNPGEAYAVGREAMVRNAGRPDAVEGMRAFLEKRAPQWEH